MRPRNLVIITLLAVCHLRGGGQALTNGLPPDQPGAASAQGTADKSQDQSTPSTAALPDDPGQEMVPVAQPEPAPAAGTPVHWEAHLEEWAGDSATLTGDVTFHYRDYVIRADKVIYNRTTSEVEADGHLQLSGGPNDVLINASHGDMRLNMHTARFYNVTGSQGVRRIGRTVVYSTTNPLLFSGRVLLQTGEGNYRIVDGSITNCRLPHPDWRIIAHSISLDNGEASTTNAGFKFLGVPIFYLPYLRHPASDVGRVSGFLIPVAGNSSVRGYILGEQIYWAISRSMDMEIGSEYYSKRGWAPSGDFRYRGAGQDHLLARWNAVLDRGIEEPVAGTSTEALTNQGGEDVVAQGRKDFSAETRVSGVVEYLSSYVYRLVFDDNYSQATSSEVSSDLGLIHQHNGLIPMISLDRFQTFASTANGDEAKILHLPTLRYDVLDRPLGRSLLTWGFGSSLSYLNRSEPDFHVRNVGRLDFYPHLSLPLYYNGWSIVPEAGLRETFYTISQYPDLTGANGGIPTVSHDPLHRHDLEASVDVRPPALERDFTLPFWNRELRHVIEPELTWRYVGGIGPSARNVLLFDTTDTVTNTNEAGFSLTQRFYLRPLNGAACANAGSGDAGRGAAKEADDSQSASGDLQSGSGDLQSGSGGTQSGLGDLQSASGESQPGSGGAPSGSGCAATPREWASWQIAQMFYIDPNFGSAVLPGRRNIFESTLDLTAATFLTSPRNLSPIISRLRFDAIDNLRIEWDLDYDPKRGQLDADNIYAGYGFGRTTFGVGHALLNAVEENPGTTMPTLKSQIVQPFLEFGKPSGAGFNLGANGSYDFVAGDFQYGGVEAVYNWDCCGLSLGYRRFELGTVQSVSRNEHEWLYGFTLANFGGPSNIRRGSVFHDPTLPPVY
jgi:LPS-assembly protein